jgi:hypothetical protein
MDVLKLCTSQPVQERNCLLQSLGYTRNKDVLNRVLNLALSPRLRDQASVLIHLSVIQITIGSAVILVCVVRLYGFICSGNNGQQNEF